MEKITGTIDAYVSPSLIGRMREAILKGNTTDAVSCMVFTDIDYTKIGEPWPKVGCATITVEVPDDDALRDGVVDALRERRAQLIAEKVAEVAKIDDQINQLLALAYEAPQ